MFFYFKTETVLVNLYNAHFVSYFSPLAIYLTFKNRASYI